MTAYRTAMPRHSQNVPSRHSAFSLAAALARATLIRSAALWHLLTPTLSAPVQNEMARKLPSLSALKRIPGPLGAMAWDGRCAREGSSRADVHCVVRALVAPAKELRALESQPPSTIEKSASASVLSSTAHFRAARRCKLKRKIGVARTRAVQTVTEKTVRP